MTNTTTISVHNPGANMMTIVASSSTQQQHPIDRSIAAFQKSLDKIAKHGQTSAASGESEITVLCLVTLSKVLDNILLERQYNPKTRSIKLGNKLFRDRVGSVPGGVDFLLACHFKYVRIASKTPLKKNPNGSIPGNAIKLFKENESRETMVVARRYLQEYGSRVMKLEIGKHRNELPPFVIHDDIPGDTLRRIQENVDAVVYEKGDRIENLGSIVQQNRKPFDDSSGSSVMTPVSQTYDMSESAPPSPYIACSSGDDDISYSSGASYGRESLVAGGNDENFTNDTPTKKETEEEAIRKNAEIENTPTRFKSDLKIPDNISPLIAHTPRKNELDMAMSLKLSPLNTKQLSMDDDISPNSVMDSDTKLKTEDQQEVITTTLEVRLHRFDLEEKKRGTDLVDLVGDDQSLGSTEEKRIASLTDEEVDAIQDITKFDSFYGSENKQVLSIANGESDERNSNHSKSGRLFTKLNKLACKKKQDGKDDDACDEKTAVTASSHSYIRIKNSDGLSIGGSIGSRRRHHLTSIFSKDKPDNSQEATGGIELKLENDVYGIDVGLKLFFAIFVVTYNFGDDTFADKQRRSAPSDHDVGLESPLIPVEIVYKLWATLLRSERGFNKMDGREIYQIFLDVAKSRDEPGRDTNDNSLLSSLEENDMSVCRYIVNSLCDSDLVSLSNISLDINQSSAGGRRSQKRLVMGIRCEASLSFGLRLATESLHVQYERNINIVHSQQCGDEDLIVQKLRKKCHNIISRSLLENIDLDSSDGMFIDQNVDFDLLSTWYIIRWLPFHLLSADMSDEALKLLLDKRYVQTRLQSNGLHLGTMQYISDCGVIRSLSKKDNDALSLIPEGDYSMRAVLAVYDAVHSHLSETKKRYSLSLPKNTKDCFCDLANALHYLAIAIGEAEGEHRTEIDILSEALRFRIAGNADKLLVAETQLQLGSCYHALGDPTKAITSYGDALQLTIDVHGANSIGLSKILYHMGVLYCEQIQYDPALECFVRALKISESQGQEFQQCEDMTKIYSWIGNVHRERGDSDLALSYFEKALQTMRALSDKECLETAEILQNIGIVFDDLGKDEKSLRALYNCLEIRRKLLHSDFHHDICETIGCIANVYRKTDIDKALRLFRIVLNAKAKKTDDKETDEGLLRYYEDMLEVAKVKLETSAEKNNELHIEIASLYFRIGSLLEKCGRYTHAIKNYLKALKIRKVKKNYYVIGDLLNSLGIAHAKRQSYNKALKCFTDSLKVRKTVMGPQHEDVAETLHNMGNCAAKQNDYDKAAEYYEKSLIIKRITLGNKSVSTANTLHRIGMVNEALGLLSDSLNYYKDALAIRTSLLGKRHIDVAFSLHSLGAIYQRTDELEKAIECFETSLRLKRRQYVGGHLSIAETMNLLATAYTSVGKADKAIPLFEETLLIFEKRFGAHMTTANVLDSLGSVYLSEGKLENSHSYLERALALKRLIYGDDDIEVSNTLYFIGKVQSKSGDLNDALNTFKDALRIRKKTFGDHSTEVAAIINDVGVIQLRRGQNDVARNCFLEAERVWKTHGGNPEYLGETLVNLGEIYHTDRKYGEAINNFNEALIIFESVHGNTHLSIALVQYKLGKSLKEQHDYDKAVTSFERALSIRSNQLGNNNMLVAEVLKDLGALCLILGDLLQARAYLSEALNTMNSKNPNGLATADTFYHTGKVMMKMKYKDEAFEAFSNALKIKRRRLEEDDLGIADTLAEMGLIEEERNQLQNSVEFYRQALQIRQSLLGDHELVADSHFSIGVVQQTIRKHHKALSSYGSALVVYQKVLGDDHITCAKTMNNIGIVYEAIEDYDEALKYHKEGLRIRTINLGKDHIKIANSLDNIAGIYQRQQESDKALQSLKESLKIRSRFGTDNLDVATTLFGMGIIYVDIGDTSKALECYESALEIRKRKGKEFEVAQSLHNIGSLWAMRQDYKKALKHWQNALQIYRRTLNDDHHMVACTLGNIKMAENMLEENSQF